MSGRLNVKTSAKRITTAVLFIFYVLISFHTPLADLSIYGHLFRRELFLLVLVIVFGLAGGFIALLLPRRLSMTRTHRPVIAVGLAVIFYFLFYGFFVLVQNINDFLQPVSICICSILTGTFSESIINKSVEIGNVIFKKKE